MTESKYKAIIVDDEPHCIETLKWELSRNCPEIEVFHTISNEEEALKIIPQSDIDLLFMDIHLQAITGVDLVRKLQPLSCEVIFVTAYDQYAIEAFDVAAVHYLLKPVNSKKLRNAIDRFIDNRKDNQEQVLELLLKKLSDVQSGEQRLAFKVQSGIEFVKVGDIMYVEGENNYSTLHFTHGKKLMVSKTLGNVEEQLKDYPFLRIHKSYLLNLKHISRYVHADGGYIEVVNGDQLSVSRSMRSTIKQLFQNMG